MQAANPNATTVISNTDDNHISRGLTFTSYTSRENIGEVISGPAYTADELRIIATHALVVLATAAGVDCAVRLEAARELLRDPEHLATVEDDSDEE